MAMLPLDYQIQKIQDSIKFADIDHDAGGIEDITHCTILYGLRREVHIDHIRACNIASPFAIRVSNLNIFENGKYDVLKLDADSPSLRLFNAELKSRLPYTNSYKDYAPHVTVAYLRKGTGAKYAEQYPGVDILLPVTDIIYYGTKVKI